nr:MAG TPA: hypothetical protein [Caudoviricetes sp.]DAY73166.1 MAG TPA: hypothetical protein [Caudoviricetes sp.]
MCLALCSTAIKRRSRNVLLMTEYHGTNWAR